MSILGNRVQRVEDPRFLTGAATYVEDLPLENAAWVTYVRSSYAHARITAVELDKARASPGVLGVFSAADVAELPASPTPCRCCPTACAAPCWQPTWCASWANPWPSSWPRIGTSRPTPRTSSSSTTSR